MQKILIATPLYPPEVGGPAKYAEGIATALKALGHDVTTLSFGRYKFLPSGLRHCAFFLHVLLTRWDQAIALDTLSVGLPTVLAARWLGKKVVVRVGGDFLWEQYVERAGEEILLSKFYTQPRAYSRKEKLIFKLTRWLLRPPTVVAFTTTWQRGLWHEPYQLAAAQTRLVPNYLPPKEPKATAPLAKTFLWAGRPLKLKNIARLKAVFAELGSDYQLEAGSWPPAVLRQKLAASYALIVPSLSDICPNIVLEGLAFGKPFILTRDTGLPAELQSLGLTVDPLDEMDLKAKIIALGDSATYQALVDRIQQASWPSDWQSIAKQLL